MLNNQLASYFFKGTILFILSKKNYWRKEWEELSKACSGYSYQTLQGLFFNDLWKYDRDHDNDRDHWKIIILEKFDMNTLIMENPRSIDIKTNIDGSRWHGRPVGVMVSYLRLWLALWYHIYGYGWRYGIISTVMVGVMVSYLRLWLALWYHIYGYGWRYGIISTVMVGVMVSYLRLWLALWYHIYGYGIISTVPYKQQKIYRQN